MEPVITFGFVIVIMITCYLYYNYVSPDEKELLHKMKTIAPTLTDHQLRNEISYLTKEWYYHKKITPTKKRQIKKLLTIFVSEWEKRHGPSTEKLLD